jgi:prevent-host-death family protein
MAVYVSTSDANNKLSALLDDVARGAVIAITRRGVPVAKLVPIGPTLTKPRPSMLPPL